LLAQGRRGGRFVVFAYGSVVAVRTSRGLPLVGHAVTDDHGDYRTVALAYTHLQRTVYLAATGRVQQYLDAEVVGDGCRALAGASGEVNRPLQMLAVHDVTGVERLYRHAVGLAERVEFGDEGADVVDVGPPLDYLHQKSPRLDWSFSGSSS